MKFKRNFLKSTPTKIIVSILHSITRRSKFNFLWVKNSIFRKIYWKLFLRNSVPKSVQIEFSTLCNRRCSYCPVSSDPRPKGYMSENILDEILAYLVSVNYTGDITPNFYNEPILYKGFNKYIKKIKKILPKTTIILNTNGDELSEKRYEELRSDGVDVFLISQHDQTTSESINKIISYADEHNYNDISVTNWTTEGRELSNRGGLVEDSRVVFAPRSGCNRALDMQIDFEGNLIVCCEDYYIENVYGNLNNESLKDIWRKSTHQRKKIYLGEYERDICKKCAGLVN